MKRSADILGRLKEAALPFFSTREAAALTDLSASAVYKHLLVFERAGLICKVRYGCWALDPDVNPLVYAAWVRAPLPSYVSLYTALYQHGIITQIPQVIYVASLGPTERFETALGTYSVHQVSPEVFGGYIEHDGVRMATPEKAIFDTLYLARARSGRFAGMTEVELPAGFDRTALRAFATKISDPAARKRVERAIVEFLREPNS